MAWFNANPDIELIEEIEKIFEKQFISRIEHDLSKQKDLLLSIFKKMKNAFVEGFIECKDLINAHEEPSVSLSAVSVYLSWDMFLNKEGNLYDKNELIKHAEFSGKSLGCAVFILRYNFELAHYIYSTYSDWVMKLLNNKWYYEFFQRSVVESVAHVEAELTKNKENLKKSNPVFVASKLKSIEEMEEKLNFLKKGLSSMGLSGLSSTKVG